VHAKLVELLSSMLRSSARGAGGTAARALSLAVLGAEAFFLRPQLLRDLTMAGRQIGNDSESIDACGRSPDIVHFRYYQTCVSIKTREAWCGRHRRGAAAPAARAHARVRGG